MNPGIIYMDFKDMVINKEIIKGSDNNVRRIKI